MTKKITLSAIKLYQIFLSPLLVALSGGSVCRFEETCSDYTKRMILEKGVLKGFGLGLTRISKCQPFYNGSLRKEII